MFTNERLFTIQAFTITRVHCSTYLVLIYIFSQEISQKELMSNYLLDQYLIPKIGYECPFIENITTRIANSVNSKLESSGGFDWNAKEQGMVLGAFYYGYIFTMLPGGYLAERYGAKWVIFMTVSLASVCSILSPIAAKFGGYGGFIAIKVIQGFVQVNVFKLLS